MKIKQYKATKKQQVFDILDKQGYILDDQSAKIFGVAKMYNVGEYVRQWKRLQADRKFFKGKKIVEKKATRWKHLVRLDGQENYYYVGRNFFDEINL